jgi:hypothetical protein
MHGFTAAVCVWAAASSTRRWVCKRYTGARASSNTNSSRQQQMLLCGTRCCIHAVHQDACRQQARLWWQRLQRSSRAAAAVQLPVATCLPSSGRGWLSERAACVDCVMYSCRRLTGVFLQHVSVFCRPASTAQMVLSDCRPHTWCA